LLVMSSDRRTLILDAAAEIIAQRGFNQTSVDDVIKKAGLCGKSHFYHYFRSKEELGYAVLDRRFESFAQSGLSLLRDPSADPLERHFRFIDSLVELQAKKGCKGGSVFGGLAAELADTHEGFRERIDAVFRRWSEHIQALLWELRPRLRADADAERLARFIIASLEGALLMSRVSREICVMEGIVADLKRFVGMHLIDGAGAGSAGVARIGGEPLVKGVT
jgi:TetR/AcrR family transcriptional repressor of nem operon